MIPRGFQNGGQARATLKGGTSLDKPLTADAWLLKTEELLPTVRGEAIPDCFRIRFVVGFLRHVICLRVKHRGLDLCQWDSEVSIKSFNFKDTRHLFSEHSFLWAT